MAFKFADDRRYLEGRERVAAACVEAIHGVDEPPGRRLGLRSSIGSPRFS
jgi:hypothetical protein